MHPITRLIGNQFSNWYVHTAVGDRNSRRPLKLFDATKVEAADTKRIRKNEKRLQYWNGAR